MVAERKQLFSLGQVVATNGASEALEKAGQAPTGFLNRHVCGDWGNVCKERSETNEQSLKDGGRILSSYRTKLNVMLWIITEADRSRSCILLPEEY